MIGSKKRFASFKKDDSIIDFIQFELIYKPPNFNVTLNTQSFPQEIANIPTNIKTN